MTETPVRIFAGFSILVLLWIGVYWWWEPDEGGISFGSGEAAIVVAEDGPLAVAASDDERVGRGRRVIPPSFVEYAIGPQDSSLSDIARKFYNDPDRWPSIARANPIMDPQRLTAGRVIRIPVDPANVQGIVVKAEPAAGPVGGPETEVEYVVLDGDTLSTISQQFYGTTKRARSIFDANRARLKLKSMDSIRAGQTLIIPRGE